jgi:hypothetical protein
VREARLAQLENTVLNLGIARALTAARAGARELFAAVFLSKLPPGPVPGTVWADLDLLTIQELWANARASDPDLPDIEGMTPIQLRRLAMEEPA